MKNSKNKIVAAAACGIIVGSIGTSLIGNFQAKEELHEVANKQSINSNEKIQDDSNRPSKPEGGRGGKHRGEADLSSTEGVNVADGKYVDGTYSGSASGFSSGLKVEVVISEGKISDVQVVNHNETPGFCERAIKTVPAEIISSQSTNVDTVTGATYTSVGIINAVNDALSNAQS